MPAWPIVLTFAALFILKYGFVFIKYVLLRPNRDTRNALLLAVYSNDGTLNRGGSRLLSYWHCGVPMWKIRRFKPDPTADISPEGSRRLTDLRICTRCCAVCEHPTTPRLRICGLILFIAFALIVMFLLELTTDVFSFLKRRGAALGLNKFFTDTVVIWLIYGAAFGIAVGIGENFGSPLFGTVVGGVLGFILTFAIPVCYCTWLVKFRGETPDPSMGMCIALGLFLAILLGILAALCSYIGKPLGIGILAATLLTIPVATMLRLPIRASATACAGALIASSPFLGNRFGTDSLLIMETGLYAVVIIAGLMYIIRTALRIGMGRPLRQAIQ